MNELLKLGWVSIGFQAISLLIQSLFEGMSTFLFFNFTFGIFGIFCMLLGKIDQLKEKNYFLEHTY